MDCPRCGVSVFTDLSDCRACGWELSRPFDGQTPRLGSGQAGVSALPSHFSSSSGVTQTFVPALSKAEGSARSSKEPKREPLIQTAADAFALSPPPRVQRVHRPRRAARQQPWSGSGAVAVLPPEARWEAPPRLEVIEMPLVQSAFDFSAAEQDAERLAGVAAAPVVVRLRAGLLDATLIVLASAVFFSLFALLSSQVSLARRDLLVYLIAGFVLTTLYFGLFTLLGGRTPGMQYYGLRPVTFDGKPLPPPVALRRAFGYAVSTGALLLGFFWAVVDERHLTWHDIISQTFLTDRTRL